MINNGRSTSNNNNNNSREDDDNSEDLTLAGRADERVEKMVGEELADDCGGRGAMERENRAMFGEEEPDENSTSSNATIIETRRIANNNNNNNNNNKSTTTTMMDEEVNRCNKTADDATIGGNAAAVIRRRPAQKPQLPPKPQLDIVRYSMANAKDDLDLDTILSELLELESQLSGDSDGTQWMLGLPTLLAAGNNKSTASLAAPTPAPKPTTTPPTSASNEAPRDCSDAVTNNNNNNTGGYTVDADAIVKASHGGYEPSTTASSKTSVSASELELRAESWTPRRQQQQQQLIHTNNNINIIESSSCASPDADSAFGDASSTSSGGGASNSSSSVTTATVGRAVAAAAATATAPGTSRQCVGVNGMTLTNASLSSCGGELATTRRRIPPSAQPAYNYRNGGVTTESTVCSPTERQQNHRYSPGSLRLPASPSSASVSFSSSVFSAQRSANRAAAAHSPSASSSSASTSSQLLSAGGDEKARKIREALQKMKEAKRKRIYVKIFLDGDTATKGLLIDERWTVAETMRQLTLKLNEDPERTSAPTLLSVDHAIVEEYPDLLISRIYEDHEHVVENIEDWLAESKNKLNFVRVPQKYDFLRRPHDYLLRSAAADDDDDDSGDPPNQQQRPRSHSPRAKRALINRFLNDGGGCGESDADGVTPPVLPLEGWLMLKADGRKTWRRHYFVLRSSGLYYIPKSGRQWRGGAASQLECLMSVYNNQIYVGASADWRKKYRAPTEYGFAIKHPKIQVKTSKYIKYICADSDATLQRWVTALRITRNGFRTLYDNYTQASAAAAADASLLSPHQSALPPLPRVADTASLASRLTTRSPSTLSPRHAQPSLFEQDECGTIKRQPFILLPPPYDVNPCVVDAEDDDDEEDGGRRLDGNERVVLEEDDFCGSGGGGGDDADSDEDEQFPPPPSIYLSTVVESNAPQRRNVPPPPPPRPPLVGGGPTKIEGAASAKPPPPPPRRAETKAVVCAVTSPSNNSRSPVKWAAHPAQQQGGMKYNGEDNNNHNNNSHYFKQQQQQPLMNELCAQLRRVTANRAKGHSSAAAPVSR